VQGSITDPMTPTNGACSDTEQIVLTNATGTILASQQASFTESDGWCALTFSFKRSI
jgi:hypothetical protein